MPIIKRYSNRKLYDVDARRYVTLDEIGAAVQRGDDVTVIDHTTGGDLTTLTLLQILFEAEKRRSGSLPGNLLAHLLRTGENNLTLLRSAYAYLTNPRTAQDEAIRCRVQTLVDRGALTAMESERWLQLLLDPQLEEPEAGDDRLSESATHSDILGLMRELDRLDQAIDQLLD